MKKKLIKFKKFFIIILISLSLCSFVLGILSSDYIIAELFAYFYGSIILGFFIGVCIGYFFRRRKDD